MIFRLEYKNKALKTARVDIITPTGTGVETVEGTGYPFQLKYEGDKKNKGLMFLSSSAEINIYETPLFNIDTLKTSGEKDIRVNYYIDSVLEWTGFVIPDFFSREIGGDGVVSMVASDRLSVLDSEVLEGLPVTVTLRTLLSSCLAKTGLTLPLKTVVDFATVSGSTNHVLNHSIRSQRLTDTKGRSVNCKDIIKSILVATNSKIMQRKGEWWVVNKMQHELGGGRVYTSPTAFTNYVEDLISFTDVTRGAMRTIAPVAGGVGVFQEYGGGALAPANYAFESGLSGWTLHNGFTASTDNRRVLGYTQSGNVATPIYDLPGTARPYLLNRNLRPRSVTNIGLNNVYTIPHARTSIPVVSSSPFSAKIKFEVNATGRGGGDGACLIVILKRPGRDNLVLNRDGQWEGHIGYKGLLFASFTGEELEAVDGSGSISGTIDAAGDEGFEDDINDYSIDLLILGSGTTLSDGTVIRDETVLINSASVQFSAASNDTPKGTLYKADQGGESYTKIHDTETTVFGDYLTGGLNGYFYNYAPDDTSSLLAPNGSRSQPAWVNTFTQNTEPLPLLQQTIRQMRRMFSVAHDFIKGEIDVADFDPLSIFEDCERRFVIVEAEFDFLRGSLQVVLEEVAYQNLTVREFIYSYFGEGDEGIRGISGISAGSSGGGGGGGVAPEPSWLENEITIDPESGLLSVDGWHVKGDLIIEGQVNQWLAQQLVVDDARIQVNRRQGGATVDSGLVIFNKDTSTEVSSLVYDVSGIWRAGGQRIYTDAYKPDSDALGGYSAASYPRKAEAAVITGAWNFRFNSGISNLTLESAAGTAGGGFDRPFFDFKSAGGNIFRLRHYGDIGKFRFERGNDRDAIGLDFSYNAGNVGIGLAWAAIPTERLHVVGNGLFTGNLTTQGNLSAVNAALSGTLGVTGAGTFGGDLTTQGNLSAVNAALSGNLEVTGASTLTGAVTAGGNVGTSNFASQLQGWRVTPQGQADFRHIYTDELQAKAFTADISQALVGSDVLTKSVAKLAQNFTVTVNGTTAPLYVEELEGFAGMQVFAVNDILLIRIFDRSGGGLLIKNVWVEVASYVGTTDNVQQFTVNVINSGGIAGQMAYAGSMILDYGQSGSGLIQRTVLDQQGSPYSRVTTWENNPWTPENHTLHYQSGNLNGLANAEGWGVYSQNSFLTGKLLVGDLTKAGQYMEYENGQLNIKGQITVTGGNAATKADVDAVQVGGRNLALNTNRGAEGWVWGTGSGAQLSQSIIAGGVNTWRVTKVTSPSSDLWSYIRYNSLNINAFKPDTDYVITLMVRANHSGVTLQLGVMDANTTNQIIPMTTADNAISAAFEWVKLTFKRKSASSFAVSQQVVYITGMNADVGVWYQFKDLKVETGNRATDWTPAPEDVDAKIADTKLYVEYSTDGTSWHTTFQASDVYMRQKTGVNGTWTGAIKIVGKDGTSVSIKGKVPTSASLPSSASLGDGYIAEDTGHLWVWTGSWTDAGQIQGDNGANSYIHIAYADDSQGGGFSHNPAGKSWIGTYADFNAIDSDTPSDYTWMYAKGQQGEPGISVSGTDVEFAQSTSATVAPTTGWQTTAPAWESGKYIWTRTKTTYSSGNPSYSAAVNLTGAKGSTGSTGAAGTGVSSITEQYYLSTSKTTQTGGSWVESPPAWEAGKYMWTRVQIVYENPTSTDYTDPIVSAEWDAIDTLKDRVENTLGLAQLEGINETLITGGKVRTALLEATEIAALVVTAERVEGLTLNFNKGKIGAWSLAPHLFYSGSWDSIFGAGSGIKLDAISNSIMAQYSIPYNSVEMFYRSPTDWGLLGKKNNATVFKLGHENEIAGITFDDSKLYTPNWELNKDGSFWFGAGGTIDGGLIAGSIESANWDGTVGTKFDLDGGSIDIGNVIKMDAFSREIQVRDTDSLQNGVRIGDFLLSPTTGGAGSLDIDLSGSRTISPYSLTPPPPPDPLYGFRPNISYITAAGAITSTSSILSSSLTAGNSYTFQTNIKARITRGNVMESTIDPIPPMENSGFITVTAGTTVLVSLFSGTSKVGEQQIRIRNTSGLGVSTFTDVEMAVNIGFTAAANTLRVEITQVGTIKWTVKWGNGDINHHNVGFIYSEQSSASRVRIIPSSSVTEISAKGFLSLWGPTKYFRIYDRAGVTNFIEARGVQQFISPNGTYRLRVSDSGIQKSTNGGQDWTTL